VTYRRVRLGLDAGGLRAEHDAVEARLVHLLPHFDEIAVRAGHEPVEHLDDVEP
jgi:hypothetical protein